LADLSQRELARLIGIDQARIARIEGGRSVDVATFAQILAAAGLRLAVVDAAGDEIEPMPPDVMRDRAGRRQPAHLDVLAAPDRPTPAMLARHREPEPRTSWHHRREERDRRRRELGLDAWCEQPTASSVAQWRRVHEASRRERARIAAQRRLARLYRRIGFPEGFSPVDDRAHVGGDGRTRVRGDERAPAGGDAALRSSLSDRAGPLATAPP
jgi:HTH-type transcriptional regulator/antitoxin HipB